MSEGEFFSSMGGIGREVRQDSRLYENANLYGLHPIMLAEHFADLLEDPRGKTENISRWILRGIVHDETMAAIQADRYGLRQNLEVALPLAELGQPGYRIYLGRNAAERSMDATLSDGMIAETASYAAPANSARVNVAEAARKGYEIRAFPSEDDIEQLTSEMWGPGFGWSVEEVEAVITQVQAQREVSPRKRTVLFSGLYNEGQLEGAAMAETLRIPMPNGTVPLVESTEWYMSEARRGQGLMPAVLAALNAQIVQCFNMRRERPLVYAECNFTSRSDRAGHAAGFRVPSRHLANQILPQHVTVNDNIEPTGLRNFTFMYLPEAAFHDSIGYDPGQTHRMMEAMRQEP